MRALTWLVFAFTAARPALAQQTQPAEAPATEAPATEAPATEAPATEAPAADAAKPWALGLHAGLNLRTDVGVHPLRLDAGGALGPIDATLVLDPMVLTDGQASTDLLLQWRSDLGLAPLLGWRTTFVPLLDGAQMQQSLLLGGAAELPRFLDGMIRGQAGLELALTLLKHGGGLPAETISFASGRHYIDLVNLALFLRLELGMQL